MNSNPKMEVMPKVDFEKSKKTQVLDKNFPYIYDPINYNLDSDTPSQQTYNSSLNCVLFTHNTALRCFVSKTLMENGRSYSKLPRFKNCAILCLTINLQSKYFELKLVYDGELSEKEQISRERPYYTKEQHIPKAGYTYFDPIHGTINDNNRQLNLLPIDLDKLFNKYGIKEVNIYEVRHGQGEHNDESDWTASIFHMKKDTAITIEGMTQATNSARELKRILKNKGIHKIHTMFCSDLKRTRETSSPFFDILLLDSLIDKREIVVLPCSEELSNFGENCYEQSAKSWKITRENYSDCTPQKCPSFKTTRINTIKINWSLYSAFYDNKIRGKPNLKEVPNCGQTNMVSMAVYYLLNSGSNKGYNNNNNNSSHISIGGTKTRKQRNKILFKNNIHNWITRRAHNKTKMKPRIKSKMKTKKKQRRYKK